MKVFVPEPVIDLYKDGFAEHDLLDRAATGKQLSELVEKFQDPIVIALDGAWGSGKSFFLKCWAGEHTKKYGGATKVIYFDAFKHDFLDDPLVALTGVLSDHFEADSKSGKALATAKKAVAKLWRPAVRIAAGIATAGASDAINAVASAALSSGAAEITNASDDFWKKENGRRAAMEEFRKALKQLTTPENSDDPQKIVIIIDELDRCRPDYALSLLEIIKHFFTVDYVHFVLGVNLKELQNSVKARYGQGVNAEKYLQKFVPLRIVLPIIIGTHEQIRISLIYFDKMVEEMGLPQYLCELVRIYLRYLSPSIQPSIREIQSLLTAIALSLSKIDRLNPAYQCVTAGLMVMRIVAPEVYNQALENKLGMNDFNSLFQINSKDEANEIHHFAIFWSWFIDPDSMDYDPVPANSFGVTYSLAQIISTNLEVIEITGEN